MKPEYEQALLYWCAIDGIALGQFATQDKRPAAGNPGSGWNEFLTTSNLFKALSVGPHQITVRVVAADTYGVEIDAVQLADMPVMNPLEQGTIAPYGIGSSIVHAPDTSVAILNWACIHRPLWEREKCRFLALTKIPC